MARSGPIGPTRTKVMALSTLYIALCSAASGMSLEQAYDLAKQHDQTFQAAVYANRAQQESIPQARSGLLPQASYSASKFDVSQKRDEQGRPTEDRDYDSEAQSLSIRQPIYRPRNWALLNQAKATVAAANAQLVSEGNALTLRLLTAYSAVLYAQASEREALAQVEFAKTRLLGAQRAFEKGAGTRTDLNEIQAQLDLQEANRLAASQLILSSTAELEMITGQKGLTALAIQLREIPENFFQLEDADTLRNQIRNTNPSVLRAQAELDAARARVSVASSEHHPTLDLVAQASSNTSDNANFVGVKTRSQSVGVQLTLPLFQGGGAVSLNRQAAEEFNRAKSLVEDTLLKTELEAKKSFYAIQEGAKRISALKQAVRSSEELVMATQKSYRAGIRTTLDILNAEQQLGQTRLRLLDAQLQRILAYARLRALAGQPDQELVSALSPLFEQESQK